MKWFALVLCGWLLVGCSEEKDSVDQRVDYWQEKINQDLGEDFSVTELNHWAKTQQIDFSLDPAGGSLIAIAETLPPKHEHCSDWLVFVKVNIKGQGEKVGGLSRKFNSSVGKHGEACSEQAPVTQQGKTAMQMLMELQKEL